MNPPRKISHSSPLQFIPPFGKGGLGGILKYRVRKSPSIPLFQRGKRDSLTLTAADPSFRRKKESRFLAGEQDSEIDTGVRRYDETGRAGQK